MKNFTYKGHKVMVFEGYNGKKMFISDSQGYEIWAHKFTGNAFEQAKRIINQN